MTHYLHPLTGKLFTEEMAEECQDALLDEEGVTGEKSLVKYEGEVCPCLPCGGEGFLLQVDPYSGMDDGGETCKVCGGSGVVTQKMFNQFHQ